MECSEKPTDQFNLDQCERRIHAGGPDPGNYRVRVVLPSASDAFSPKDAAVNDQTDSDINPSGVDLGFTDTFNIASNVISTTIYDAGIIKFKTPTPTRTPTPINIGNLVWHDLNGNGIQDAGEPGIAGITVQLWNAAKNNLIFSAVTNANGIYTVIAPVQVTIVCGLCHSTVPHFLRRTRAQMIRKIVISMQASFRRIMVLAIFSPSPLMSYRQRSMMRD
ncbi:SdrD B-like domain-containing protein [Candidatus Villigracilis saccharophilus]|uniref:SdrD B-like domain-containing protein n=1 Tax=Candidatus Villigracilis saccharophilus TaxID=3140684 RepID=UPI003134BF2E|nr:hypothetical protein [Anaerolineales bacterium]